MLEFWSMGRALVLLFAALVSFGLVVTASADPPDPTWIAGCWDDDDQDTAVIAILAIPGWAATADPIFVNVLATYPLPAVANRVEIVTPDLISPESRGPPLVLKHLA
jgi:hypothetical protein